MKKTQKILAMFILMFVLMATTCFATEDTPVATSEEPDTNATSEEGEVPSESENISEQPSEEGTSEEESLHEDDLYAFSNDISVTQLVDGNAYLFGQNITISGQIGGDVFAMADTLTIEENSQIYGNLYVLANNIVINGVVCDLYSVGTTITLGETGIVLRDMRTISNTLNFNGSIGRNTYITTNTITLGEKAYIYGNLNYSAREAIQVPAESVEGEINFTQLAVQDNPEEFSLVSYAMDLVCTLVYTIVLFAVIRFFAPRFFRNLGDVVAHKSIVSFGIGVAGLIVTIPVAFLLIFTYVGVPVAFALLSVWAFVLFGLSSAITSIALGSFIGSKVSLLGKAHNLLGTLLVSIVLWALLQVPFYVGTVVQWLVFIFGMGYLLVTAFQNRQKEEVEV